VSIFQEATYNLSVLEETTIWVTPAHLSTPLYADEHLIPTFTGFQLWKNGRFFTSKKQSNHMEQANHTEKLMIA
jgi:hypothetical protein